MIKYSIQSISIEGFRGINNEGRPLVVQFKADGVTSIFGENGKGKSSIFEAFIFSILGRIIRFDDYHGDIFDKKSIKNIFHSGDGHIIIKFIDASNNVVDINVKVNSNGDRSISSSTILNPNEFLAELCSSLNFIDYTSFQKIMLTSSEETGKLFSNLVGFGNFIKIKEKLDKISRTQNINNDFGKVAKETTLNNNLQRKALLELEILEKLVLANSPIDQYEEAKVLKLIQVFLKKQFKIQLKEITKDTQLNFDEEVRKKIGSLYEENVNRLNSQQQYLNDLKNLQNGLNGFDSKVINRLKIKLKSSYKEIKSETDIVLGKLYDDAITGYDLVTEFDKNACILCNTDGLGNSSATFYEQVNLKVDSYLRFKDKYQFFYDDYVGSIQSYKIDQIQEQFFQESIKKFEKHNTTNGYFSKTFFENNGLQKMFKDYRVKLLSEIRLTSKNIKELYNLVPPKLSDLIEVNNIFKSIFTSAKEIKQIEADNLYLEAFLLELDNWIKYINDFKEKYENSYNVLMEDIASMIDENTKSFFKEIMGNVEITPKLKKEYKGQKVNVLLEKFYTNTTDLKAVPLLSESYRNALSLSIYFATALKNKNSGNFIIVDDITSSFDSGHQIFLLELIKKNIALSSSNKKGKQIIFLTHDGTLKKALNENASSQKNWIHYSLNSNKDMASLKPITSLDLKNDLIDKINNNQYEGTGLRLYYESVLLEIIEKLNLEIPFSLIHSNDEKMVNKLISAISEIVEIKVKSKRIKQTLVPGKSDFKSYIQQFGNNLSHWASASQASISQSVLIKIVDDITLFKQKFQYNCTCTKNSGWVYYKGLIKNPVQKGCSCVL